MSLIKTGLMLSAALCLSAFVCSAQESPMSGTPAAAMHRADPSERFAGMDSNADGRLSKEEFFTARPSLTQNAFEAIDGNHDGFIGRDEWTAFSSGHGGAMKTTDMGAMMKGMKGMGGVRSEGAGPSSSGMPLIMPPASSSADTQGRGADSSAGMPLIMPPSGK